jgi:pimeloyl-ACP methyl ester carboxylesterase
MNANGLPPPTASGTTASGIYYEVHGQTGPLLFLGFPVTASPDAIPAVGGSPTGPRFLAPLVDRYRVLVADYPSLGRSATVPPSEFTVDRVCADLLGVADAAGFDRFAWWGGTFGAIAGLQLATRTDRVNAFVSAGWPPLGGPYAAMLEGTRRSAANPPPHALSILRDPAQYTQWVTYYQSLDGWPDEASAVARMTCPRLVVYGAHAEADVAGIPLPLAATIRHRRDELVALGWRVVEVPDRDSALILDPETLVPIVRSFLDSVL